ncbi:hypothetical protein [Pontibacter pamirensis]|uniref:hypothetical protein n=1 Tax=Pontibacter pamirensis TaxID=2562824 RepID=UPI00138A5EFD|nr:hypothetical protein [Pontibacter pamirensis]
MQAFLYIELTTHTTYSKPLPEQVKRQLPEVAVLDIDAGSDELLQHYALRLLRESDQAVVCIKADANTPGLGKAMAILEELFEEKAGRLVLLLGEHSRLQRMFQARPHVQLRQVEEEEALNEVKQFLAKV